MGGIENPIRPIVACKVDGIPISSFTDPRVGPFINYLQCQSTTPLSGDDEHLLELKVERLGPNTPHFHLDYLIYDAEVREERLVGPASGDVRVIIDDADTQIEYGEPPVAWSSGGSGDEHANTTHFTDVGGATATYKFFGTGIEAYGTLGMDSSKNPFAVTFTVDNDRPVEYRSPDVKGGGLNHKMRLFKSAILDEGEHTLLITNSAEGARRFILDFLVQSIAPSALISQPDPSGSPAPFDPPGSSDTTTKNGPNVGLIAGASVGGVLLLALLLSLLLWRRRRSQRASRGRIDLTGPTMSSSTITPYSYGNSGSSILAPHGRAASDSTLRDMGKPGKEAHSSPSLPPVPPQRTQQHAVDGGVRLAGGDDDELLPPVYQPSYGTHVS